MLKLRYFWKLTHLNDLSITSCVFKHRRKQSISTKMTSLSPKYFSYQKSHHLVEPSHSKDFFPSASARCNFVKILLYPRAFARKCNFCSLDFDDVLSHQLLSCIMVEKYISLLRSKLILYNFPVDKLTNMKFFLKKVLERKILTKCFAEFLADIDHGSGVHK